MSSIGILLVNTGTPAAPTTKAVRAYLKEFLSDRRMVHLPRLIWLPILYGLILPFRAKRSAALYQEIWTPQGSPMRVYMQSLAIRLQAMLNQRHDGHHYLVELGMNYGSPSIAQGLESLKQRGAEKYIVLPLFPQYSDTTTASSMDRVKSAINKWPNKNDVRIIEHYYDRTEYIEALATVLPQQPVIPAQAGIHPNESSHSAFSSDNRESISMDPRLRGDDKHLLISFHGIPKRFVAAGDPYQQQCETTAKLLADKLGLHDDEWTLCYQSKFGYDDWLLPSTQTLLTELPKRGIRNINIICPGFAVDCLETLEEIAITGKEAFLAAGGEEFHYMHALNDSSEQAKLLASLL